MYPRLTSLLESDEELFEDDPAEYIRRDLEGADSDTRRRSATDLIRGLLDPLERPVTSIVTTQISVFLSVCHVCYIIPYC